MEDNDLNINALIIGGDTAPLSSPSSAFAAALELALEYAANARSSATLRAYSSDWSHYIKFCALGQVDPGDARAVAGYIAALDVWGERKFSTIQRRLTSIRAAFRKLGKEDPTASEFVRLALEGIKRNKPTRRKGVNALRVAQLQAITARLPDTDNPKDARDKALLLIAFQAGGMRRSELVGLNFDDLLWEREGIAVLIRRSKTDQAGEGRLVGVPWGQYEGTCPVKSLQAWIDHLPLPTSGPIFRRIDRHGNIGTGRLSAAAVSLIVKARLAEINIDPVGYSAHSIRVGFVTEARARGADEYSIRRQTGHRSLANMETYIRDSEIFRDNAATKTGL